MKNLIHNLCNVSKGTLYTALPILELAQKYKFEAAANIASQVLKEIFVGENVQALEEITKVIRTTEHISENPAYAAYSHMWTYTFHKTLQYNAELIELERLHRARAKVLAKVYMQQKNKYVADIIIAELNLSHSLVSLIRSSLTNIWD